MSEVIKYTAFQIREKTANGIEMTNDIKPGSQDFQQKSYGLLRSTHLEFPTETVLGRAMSPLVVLPRQQRATTKLGTQPPAETKEGEAVGVSN